MILLTMSGVLKPDGNMRVMPFGKRAEGMAIYVILEEQRRVVVVSVTWLELFT